MAGPETLDIYAYGAAFGENGEEGYCGVTEVNCVCGGELGGGELGGDDITDMGG
jgi:hypothetical protein